MHAVSLAFVASLLIGGCAAEASGPKPLTRDWLRSTPPEKIATDLFGELGRSLFLVPGQIPGADDRLPLPVRSLSFQMRPRASYRAGLCETDWIRVELEPVPVTLALEDGVRPRRLTVLTNYIVQNLAKVREGGPSVDEMPELERACAAIDPTGTPSIVAGSAFDITGTVPLVADLVEAARNGRSTAPLQCEGDEGAMPEVECLRMLAAVRPEAIATATLDAGCGRKATDVYCRTARTWHRDRELSIAFEMQRGGRVPVRVGVRMLPDERAVIN